MKFESVLPFFREGKMIRRTDWEIGSFIFKQVPAKIDSEIIPKMQSLPDDVKNILLKRRDTILYGQDSLDVLEFDSSLFYRDQVAFVNKDNGIMAYAFSAEDLLSAEWEIIFINYDYLGGKVQI